MNWKAVNWSVNPIIECDNLVKIYKTEAVTGSAYILSGVDAEDVILK